MWNCGCAPRPTRPSCAGSKPANRGRPRGQKCVVTIQGADRMRTPVAVGRPVPIGCESFLGNAGSLIWIRKKVGCHGYSATQEAPAQELPQGKWGLGAAQFGRFSFGSAANDGTRRTVKVTVCFEVETGDPVPLGRGHSDLFEPRSDGRAIRVYEREVYFCRWSGDWD